MPAISSRLLVAFIIFMIAIVFFYGAIWFHNSKANELKDLVSVRLLDDLASNVKWVSSNYPGLGGNIFKPGRMILTRDLELIPVENTGSIIITKGNTVICWTCNTRPIPFFASLALVAWIAGIYLIVSIIHPIRLSYRQELILIEVFFILMIISTIYSIVLPNKIYSSPEETYYIKIEQAKIVGETIIVYNGTLLTSKGLIAEKLLDWTITIFLAGYSIMFLGIALRLLIR